MELRSELPYPRHCSAEALHQFFTLANRYLPIDAFPPLLESILPRIRRSPHEILCPELIRLVIVMNLNMLKTNRFFQFSWSKNVFH